MPKDNIQRAINKAVGGEGENYEEIRYEGYGPGGVALIVEAMTDNRNRTASDIRSYFTKSGGNLAETGAVSFMFDRVGLVEFEPDVADADTMLEAAIEAGADDVVSSEDGHEIYCDQHGTQRGHQGARRRSSASRRPPSWSGSRRPRSPSTTRPARSSCG